jgi:hypothetical protein
MVKMTFMRDASTLITDAEVSVTQSTGGETAAAYYTRMLTEYGLTEASNTIAVDFNGDDSSWNWPDVKVSPKWKIPMLSNFTYGSESHFGFSDRPFTTTASPGTTNKSRGYTAGPIAPLLFFWGNQQDSGSAETRIVAKPGVMVLKARDAHYGGSGTQWMVAVFTPTKITYFFKKGTGTAHGFWAATYTTAGAKYSEQKIADLYATGDTTTVVMAFERNYVSSGSWKSNPQMMPEVTAYYANEVDWVEDKPEGTSIEVSAYVTANIPTTSPVVSGDATTNIALNKPVTLLAPSVPGTKPSSLVTDGDTLSANYFEAPAPAATVEIDLGGIARLSSLKIWHYYTDGRTYLGKKVQVSVDKVTWVTVYDQTVDANYAESAAGKTHTVDIDARYIRDTINGSTANASNHWVEIQAFGVLTTEIYNYPADELYVPVAKGGSLTGFIEGEDLTNRYVWLKVDLASTVVTSSPGVSNLRAYFEGISPQNLVQIDIEPTARFNNNEDVIKVVYDQNVGLLLGDGGYVEAFTVQFTPAELVPNPNPGLIDSIRTTPSVGVNFIPIFYSKINGAKTSIAKAKVAEIKVTFTKVGVVNP